MKLKTKVDEWGTMICDINNESVDLDEPCNKEIEHAQM